MLLAALTLLTGMTSPARDSLVGCVTGDVVSDGMRAERDMWGESAARWAEVREEQDRVVYRTAPGARRQNSPLPGAQEDRQLQQAWDAIRDFIEHQRSQREPSLTFPEDDVSRPQQ